MEIIDDSTISFNGEIFKRNGNSKYFRRTIHKFLHREVWERYNGPIPLGHHIHHIDGNPYNNDISNLECLSESAHHKKEWTQHREKKLVHALRNIKKVYKRGRTKQHRRRMSQWSKEYWASKKPVYVTCLECKIKFETRMPELAKYCCRKCQRAKFKRNIDNVDGSSE